jgi:hypothetical protein
MAYSNEQRALALAILRRYDNSLTKDALVDIAEALGRQVSKSVLHGWLKTQAHGDEGAAIRPAPSSGDVSAASAKSRRLAPVRGELIADADMTLDALYEQIARKYLRHAGGDDVIFLTKGRDAVTAAAIATDKMRLLRDIPPDIARLLPELLREIERANLNAGEVFGALLARLRDANSLQPGR